MLTGEVVDLVGPRLLQHLGEGVLVEQVGGHDLDPVEEVLDALVAVVAGAAHHADHLVPLGQEDLGEVGPVLAGHAGDEGLRHGCGGGEVASWQGVG